MKTRDELFVGWKGTASGHMMHAPKGRFPLEAICGTILVDGKDLTNLEPCIKCMDSEARRKKAK